MYRHDGAFRDAVGIGYNFSPMQNLQWIRGGNFYGGAVEGDGDKGLGFEDYSILGFCNLYQNGSFGVAGGGIGYNLPQVQNLRWA